MARIAPSLTAVQFTSSPSVRRVLVPPASTPPLLALDRSLPSSSSVDIVNGYRVLRWMHKDRLLCLRSKPVAPHTTGSRHGLAFVPLARDLRPALDQRWDADIRSVRLGKAFIHLAVACSMPSRASHRLSARRPTGSHARDSGAGRGDPVPIALFPIPKRAMPVRHLRRALAGAPDRRHMSLVASPYDNSKAEGLMKTLKAE